MRKCTYFLTRRSACLAEIHPELIKHDTVRTVQQMNIYFTQYRNNKDVVDILVFILESLIEYHLPAEAALFTIDQITEADITRRYKQCIKDIRIDSTPTTNSNDGQDNYATQLIRWVWNGDESNANSDYGPNRVANDATIAATSTSTTESFGSQLLGWLIYYRPESVSDDIDRYKLQKTVIVIHALFTATTEPVIRFLASQAFVNRLPNLDPIRLTLCKGMLLSVFVRGKHPQLKRVAVATMVNNMLVSPTMWGPLDVWTDEKTRINDYIKRTMSLKQKKFHRFKITAGSETPLSAHVYLQNFIEEIENYLNELETNGVLAAAYLRENLLNWALQLWYEFTIIFLIPINQYTRILKSSLTRAKLETQQLEELELEQLKQLELEQLEIESSSEEIESSSESSE
jgi:hypothetical protein